MTSSSLTSFGLVPAIPFSSTPVIISISSLSSSTFSKPRLLTAWTFGPVFFFLNENEIPKNTEYKNDKRMKFGMSNIFTGHYSSFRTRLYSAIRSG